jgi:hypothetical protein
MHEATSKEVLLGVWIVLPLLVTLSLATQGRRGEIYLAPTGASPPRGTPLRTGWSPWR